MCGYVIANKGATLYELKTIYTIEDLYDLCEAMIVPQINEYFAVQEAQKMNKKGVKI